MVCVIVNVSDLLRSTAERDPDGTALIENRAAADGPARREVTWRELDDAADAVARGLSARGLVAGHRVALVMANRVDLPIAYFGILRGGMVAVPINPRSTAAEIARMITDSGARIALVDETAVAQTRSAMVETHHPVELVVDGCEAVAAETTFADFLARATGTAPVAPRDPESLAVILYTSGSSGRPRGAMLTHRALLANIEQVANLERAPIASDDVALGLLPMFHVYGLNAVLGQAVRHGAAVVLVDGFDPAGLLDLVVAEGVTNLPLAPPIIAAWAGRPDLREKLAGIRVVLSGASSLDADLAEEFWTSSGHVVEQGYGLTEAAPVISVTLASPRGPGSLPVAGSVGHALPGVEVKVLDTGRTPADHLTIPESVVSGDPSEIWVRGDNLFSGYWPDGAEGPGVDGWYATGDIGIIGTGGELVLVDRVRELVIVSGFNVYPREIEDVIAEVRGVQQVAVVGLPHEETGEAVAAFVEADPSAAADPGDLVEAIEARCRTRLARFKQPTQIVVVSGLPRSATGKIEKGRLRAQARSGALGLDAR